MFRYILHAKVPNLVDADFMWVVSVELVSPLAARVGLTPLAFVCSLRTCGYVE